MKFFDSHVHFFPDKLAGKALPQLSRTCGCPYYSDGTRAGTLAKMEAWQEENSFAGAMALHIATSPRQQAAVNNFAAQSQQGKLFCFGSVFPTAPDALEEMERIKALGLHGVKLHPDYQAFFIEDPCALPLYAQAEKLGLPVAFHTGRDPYSPYLVHCHPAAVARVARRFPGLTIIAAHMGGMEPPNTFAGRRTCILTQPLPPASLRRSSLQSLCASMARNACCSPQTAPGALCLRSLPCWGRQS